MFSTTKLLAGAAILVLASTLLWSGVLTPPQERQVRAPKHSGPTSSS